MRTSYVPELHADKIRGKIYEYLQVDRLIKAAIFKGNEIDYGNIFLTTNWEFITSEYRITDKELKVLLSYAFSNQFAGLFVDTCQELVKTDNRQQNQIDKLETQVDNLEAEVAKLNGFVEICEADYDKVNAQLRQSEQRVYELKLEVIALKAELTEVKTELAEVKTELKETIASNTERIEALETAQRNRYAEFYALLHNEVGETKEEIQENVTSENATKIHSVTVETILAAVAAINEAREAHNEGFIKSIASHLSWYAAIGRRLRQLNINTNMIGCNLKYLQSITA